MPRTVEELSPEEDDLGRFLALAADVARAGSPGPPLPDDAAVDASLRREIFAGRQRAFLARSGEAAAARLVARLHPELTDARGRPVGMLGFYEALDRRAAAVAVLDSGVAWLRERGAGAIVGPMDGDTWHRYRLNLGPHDEPPFPLEPHNPPWYPAQWEAAGFAPLADYASLRLDELERAAAALAAPAARAERAGYRLEPLEPERFDGALERIYRLTVESFEGNLLYTRIPRRDFLALYAGARALADPRLVWFAVAADGADTGFVFAYPDAAGAVQLKTLGVVPEHRRTGVGAALVERVYRQAPACGLDRANLCLIRDGNPSRALDGGHGEPFRRYRLYARGGGELAA